MKCKQCAQAFRYQHLSRHVNGYCPGRETKKSDNHIVVNEDVDKCPLCQMTLTKKQTKETPFRGIFSHVKLEHSGMELRIRCSQCSLPKHPLTLGRHKLYSCPSRPVDRSVHVVARNGNVDRVLCPVENCKMELGSGGLASHLKKQHGVVQSFRVKCKQCKKSLYPSMLSSHLRTCRKFHFGDFATA